ncbi:MAG: succinyl-diaminopimelate desuccinylase [Rhizomicrobium sp.]
MAVNPVALAQSLIRRPSITPHDEGAITVLEEALTPLGFTCHHLRFEEPGVPAVENLYARIGTLGPHFCFAGHTDVVPPGNPAHWKSDPFAANIQDGVLIGRGAADMKGAIAAFTAAVSRHLAKGPLKGSISLMITGDEEGDAINGTPKILNWLKARGESIDHSLFGEPTSIKTMGDTIKIGRRGSMNVTLTAHGTQGHVAYANELKNPIHALAALTDYFASHPLDQGSALFDPSTLTFTTFDVGNPTVNLVPAEAKACFNIRFSDLHTPESLADYIRLTTENFARKTGCTITAETSVSGVASAEQPGAYTDLLQNAIATVTGVKPALSTSGGTSDARFITDFCPAVEFGLFTESIHKVDECAAVADIEKLTDMYEAILAAYFAG